VGRGVGALVLTVLGCDGSYAGPGGACSGYLLRGGGATVWIDAGPGTLAQLQLHVPLAQVNAVVLSHEHPDHWTDIEGFAVACTYGPGRPGVTVLAPAGLRSLVRGDLEDVFAWQEVTDGEGVAIEGMRITFSRTDHGPETLALRLDYGDRSLGYSADTGPSWSLEALGPGLDLALCEATFTAGDEGRLQHLSARQAGASARSAGVPRLLLTHRWPTVPPDTVLEEGAGAFGSAVEVAEMGRSYVV
jgi:ribonuclease BN (tRNA processing enzyme)